MVPLSKFHSYGNDFVMVEATHLEEAEYPVFSKAVCTPHFGIGADGCVVLKQQSSRDFGLRIFNQDGSEAGMSGNGARCAAASIHRARLSESSELQFSTSSGLKRYTLEAARPPNWEYSSDLGAPGFAPGGVPIRSSEGKPAGKHYELEVAGETIKALPLWIGNPQCVVFVESLPPASEFERIGAGLESHSFFPEKTNVSFVEIAGPNELEIKIWERGVGPTHSSGTGSSGAAVAAVLTGKVRSPVRVSTATGTQRVEWEPSRSIRLTGEATFVADANFYWQG